MINHICIHFRYQNHRLQAEYQEDLLHTMNSYHVQMILFLTPVQPHPPSAPLYATVALAIRLPPLDPVVFLINSILSRRLSILEP